MKREAAGPAQRWILILSLPFCNTIKQVVEQLLLFGHNVYVLFQRKASKNQTVFDQKASLEIFPWEEFQKLPVPQ